MPTVLFRCDGYAELGMQHVKRCLALALTFRARGAYSHFILSPTSRAGADLIMKTGFEATRLEAPTRSKLPEFSATVDCRQTRVRADSLGACAAVVDLPDVTGEYFAPLKSDGRIVVVIDDTAQHDFCATDLLVNPNAGAERLFYDTEAECMKLLGARYALLRPELRAARLTHSRQPVEDDHHLLLTLEGDCLADVKMILASLTNVSRPMWVRCVMSERGEAYTKLQSVVDRSPHTIEFLSAGNDLMPELLVWADLALVDVSPLCWELCCLGLPMVTLSRSARHQAIAKALEREGVALTVSDLPGSGGTCLPGEVDSLLRDPVRREGMSLRGRALVDGHGATRVADILWARLLGRGAAVA